MAMEAFFTTANGIVTIQMRAVNAGMVGDMNADIHEGQDFAGIPYADLIQVGTGKIAFDENGHGAIVQ